MKTAAILSAFLVGCCLGPEGGTDQIRVPDTAKAGEPIVVESRAVVVDPPMNFCGGPIKGRFKDMRLYYRLVGETDWHPLESDTHVAIVAIDDARELYQFIIPPLSASGGEIEYYYEFVFDGRPNRVDGVKRIALLPER
jgi:hypothetical protein